MDISGPNQNQPKRKRGRPSKQDAEAALNLIKVAEQEKNELEQQRAAQTAAEHKEREKILALEELEKARVLQAQQLIKRRLRENLKKKEEQDRLKNNKLFLETSVGKVKWKSLNSGHKLQGFIKDKLIFEIQKGMLVYNLYVKDPSILREKKIKSYQGCSSVLEKIKEKSEKFAKAQKLI